MSVTPLHRLAQLMRSEECIEDENLLETLGRDSTITVPREGGGERLLPSGEILSVLADSMGMTVDQVLARCFCMSPDEISTAGEFMRLVQFAPDLPGEYSEDSKQPFQPFER